MPLELRQRQMICWKCAQRDRTSPNRDSCRAGGLSSEHAQKDTCPLGLHVPPPPPAPELVWNHIKGPWKRLKVYWAQYPEVQAVYRRAMADAANAIPAYHDDAQGRGILICGGGSYAFSALITLAMIRHTGCTLPVEIWGFDASEFPDWFAQETAKLGATLHRADEFYSIDPVRGIYDRDKGWTLKAYAILHSRFREILYLDADSYPVRDPSDLFERPEYIEHGAIFWPDTPDTGGTDFPESVWQTIGITPRSEPEFEAGQFIIDKARCWTALRLLNWMNQHSDFYYWFDRQHAYGDKSVTHLAWRYLGMDYGMPAKRPDYLEPAMVQYDFADKPIFVHRVKGKFTPIESLDQYAVFKTTHQLPDRYNSALPLEEVAWEIEGRYLPLVPKPEPKKKVVLPPSSSWGTALWDMLHRRPISCDDLAREKTWLRLFARKIPCGDCQGHWNKIVEAHPPDLSSHFAYAHWTHDRQNDVNTSIGKPIKNWFDAAMEREWWKVTDGMPTRLAIATLWTESIVDVTRITLPTKRRYAVKWGLPYIEHYGVIRLERPPAWSKLSLLINHLPKYDWIFWTDADALFMQDQTDLRDMLDDSADLIWTEDHNGPNTGAFYIRNTPASIDLLTRADALFNQLSQTDRQGRFRGLWEQGAIRYVIEEQLAAVKVKTLPKRSINAYEVDYETGDLIVHFPAHDKMERIKKFLDARAAAA